MPKLSLVFSGDGLGAKLRVQDFTLAGWKSEWAGTFGQPAGMPGHETGSVLETGSKLAAFLRSQGIAPACIRTEALEWIERTLSGTNEADEAALARDLESVQDLDVAQGFAPVHEEPLGLAFLHAYLSDAETIAELRRKGDALGFEGLRDSMDPASWVGSGETVLSFQSVAQGKEGMDVLGAPIPFLAVRDRLPPFGKSLFLNGRKLIAICEGALILENGRIKVLGSDSLPTCQVVVAEDLMSANLVLGGNHLNDWMVTLDMVRAALNEQGVASMLPESEVLAALSRFNRDRLPLTLLIARGRPPVPGRDGRLTLLVDPEPDVPLPGPDGSIDFKNFSFFKTVSQGARLAQVLPPAPGEAGRNVLGGSIPPPEGLPFACEPGRNTVPEGSDPRYLTARVAGRLALRDGIPEVVEVLDVAGDVSLKSGNIEFPGAVKVSGDVHSHMELRSAGDVEVDGTVEDCVIRSDGAIVIKGGVNGQGNGLIKSRLSSVTLGYLHNQRIESHSHIAVFNEIINSTLLARKTITMRFGKYAVMGGHLLAGEGMDLFNVGSGAGSKTLLEVGKDFEVEAEIADKNARLQGYFRDLEFLRDMEDQLAGVIRLRRGASDEDALLQTRTQGAMEILDRWIVSLRKELVELSGRLYGGGPFVILIRGIAHPGTVLKYRDEVVMVAQAVRNRKWVFRDKGPLPSPDGKPI